MCIRDSLYIHGSAASRMLRQMKGGVPVCVTVTLLDGLVLARSVFKDVYKRQLSRYASTPPCTTPLDTTAEGAISSEYSHGRSFAAALPHCPPPRAASAPTDSISFIPKI